MLMEPQARGATGAVAPAPLEEKDLPKGASEGGTAGRGVQAGGHSGAGSTVGPVPGRSYKLGCLCQRSGGPSSSKRQLRQHCGDSE